MSFTYFVMISSNFIFFNDFATYRAQGQGNFISFIYSGSGLCLPSFLIVTCTDVL